MFSRAHITLFLATAVVFWACGEPSPSDLRDEDLSQTETTFSVHESSVCDEDFKGLQRDSRGFFDPPEQQEAAELLRAAEDACDANEDPAPYAWDVLRLMERVLNAGRSGSTDDGVGLAHGTLHLAGALPNPGGLGDPIDPSDSNSFSIETSLIEALGFGGIFAVVEDTRSPEAAAARDPVPFTLLTTGSELEAVHGVAPQVVDDWSDVIGANPALIVAHPVRSGSADPLLQDFQSGSTSASDQLVTELAYRYSILPDPGIFSEQLRVAACFSEPIEAEDSDLARMSKNGVLLQDMTDLCDEIQAASMADGSIMRTFFSGFADLITPRPLHAFAFSFSGITGGAGSFSEMGSVIASGTGSLVFTEFPSEVIRIEADDDCLTDDGACALLGPVAVQALTTAGTPIEAMTVVLSIDSNEGEPAGAVLRGNSAGNPPGALEEFTAEGDGIATFGNEVSLQVDKPGGYRLCANVEGTSFNLAEACVDFHVRSS